MLVYWEGLVCQHSEWHCVFGVMVFFVIVQLPTFQILLARTKVCWVSMTVVSQNGQ